MNIQYLNIFSLFILPFIFTYRLTKSISKTILLGSGLIFVHMVVFISFNSLPDSGKELLTLITNNTEYNAKVSHITSHKIKSHGKYKITYKSVVNFTTNSNHKVQKVLNRKLPVGSIQKLNYNEFTDIIVNYNFFLFVSIIFNIICCYFFTFYIVYIIQVIFGWKTKKTKKLFKKITGIFFPFINNLEKFMN